VSAAALALWAVLAGAPARPLEPVVKHFAEVPLAKLQVMQLLGDEALVEGPGGEVALVRQHDRLGREKAKVVVVGQGCVKVRLSRLVVPLCAEPAPGPRS